jgi:hypothetical protein
MNSLYKEQHESFVSNLSGTDVITFLLPLLHLPFLIIISKILHKGRKSSILLEFAVLILPVLLVLTVCADYAYWTLSFCLGTVVLLLLKERKHNKELSPIPETKEKGFITFFKGTVVIYPLFILVFLHVLIYNV